ncbi:cyclic nucleotide-binding domain-containing protein [Oscillochloris sp. ZM17-4]|uniref:cyclic nucleotide-binding domain-containing protein n=1 Tax=Oscillochloris sp. ZM17-4 TaxID=2866714 RepID=UPI001C72D06A|nr:cyclic nucleotide-binding domain-containing protein [Oscillochloris sp. ZM17-4]MBX0329179.1 cyclic nucleotide-binding domain-containing protein [Oscillochloris sp. ZM17-4]
MMTVDERRLVLRRARIFASTPDAALLPLADLAEELVAAEGQQVVAMGDPGDRMYLIASGRMRVHDGDLLLNYLEEGDSFGELSVFDSQPRSASVTAARETTMLCLRQEPLRALVSANPEVAHGVIGVLCHHLRNRVRDVVEDYSYISQVGQLTAAAHAVEDGTYETGLVSEVARRTDALGQLARTFQRMADEVQARERQLRSQIQELRVEIDRSRQARQVSEITESDYFQRLRRSADELRRAVARGSAAGQGDDRPRPDARDTGGDDG